MLFHIPSEGGSELKKNRKMFCNKRDNIVASCDLYNFANKIVGYV